MCLTYSLVYINNLGHCIYTLFEFEYREDKSRTLLGHLQSANVGTLSVFSCIGRIFAGVSSDISKHKYRVERSVFLILSAIVFVVSQTTLYYTVAAENLNISSAMVGFAYGILFGIAPVIVSEVRCVYSLYHC